MSIGLCTDSSSQLPPDLATRFGVEIVPQTIVIDDEELLEGVDIDADGFYGRYTADHCPVVMANQPSPGQFAVAYDELAAAGCTEILSIHVASTMSSTLNAARLAARCAPVPVRIVDSGTASFGTSCCVWAAAEAIAAGGCLEHAANVAESLAPKIGNVFLIGAPHLVGVGAHIDPEMLDDRDGIPVFTLRNGKIDVLERVGSMESALRVMAAFLTGWGAGLRVALGLGDRRGAALVAALQDQVCASPQVAEVINYRLGASIGANIGPGCVSGFVFPGTFPLNAPS